MSKLREFLDEPIFIVAKDEEEVFCIKLKHCLFVQSAAMVAVAIFVAHRTLL